MGCHVDEGVGAAENSKSGGAELVPKRPPPEKGDACEGGGPRNSYDARNITQAYERWTKIVWGGTQDDGSGGVEDVKVDKIRAVAESRIEYAGPGEQLQRLPCSIMHHEWPWPIYDRKFL